MDESILKSVKKVLGIDENYEDFDQDVMMTINSAIHTLYQIGYDNAKNFIVTSHEDEWEDLFEDEDDGLTSLIKSYIYTKVRMLFDPPTSSFVLTSLENQNKELEWRIYAELEGGFDEPDICHHTYLKPSRRHPKRRYVDCCCGPDPWEGVPRNHDECGGPWHLKSLRRLRDEMGRP